MQILNLSEYREKGGDFSGDYKPIFGVHDSGKMCIVNINGRELLVPAFPEGNSFDTRALANFSYCFEIECDSDEIQKFSINYIRKPAECIKNDQNWQLVKRGKLRIDVLKSDIL